VLDPGVPAAATPCPALFAGASAIRPTARAGSWEGRLETLNLTWADAAAARVVERTRGLEQQLAECKQTERALRENEAFTRAVLDNLPLGIAARPAR
jgi:hypothetical protein